MEQIAAEVANIALITIRLLINAQASAGTANSQPLDLLLQKLLAQKQFFTANFEGVDELLTKQTNAATVRYVTNQQRRCLRSCC